MNDNNLISTIDSLKSLGQYEAIKAMAESLKESYEYANNILYESGHLKREYKIPEDLNLAATLSNNNGVNKVPVEFSKELQYKSYDKSWTHSEKFLFILKVENRFLHFREAGEVIKNLENLDKDSSDIAGALTNATRYLKKDKIIVKIQHGNSKTGYFWGSPKWLNEDGSIKKEHMYKTDILKSRRDKGMKPLFRI